MLRLAGACVAINGTRGLLLSVSSLNTPIKLQGNESRRGVDSDEFRPQRHLTLHRRVADFEFNPE